MTHENMIRMKVTGLTIDPFTSMPIIILKDEEEKKALPIWIGLIEASAIATELEHIKLARPMTHDLLKNILDVQQITVREVAVTELKDNTFFANISLLTKEGKAIDIDSRPSDAIAIALRTNAPIYVSDEVVEKSRRIDLAEEESGEDQRKRWAEILENLSPEDFGKYKM